MLYELEKTENLKTQEFANRGNFTPTEAVRQLQRLTEALLIGRNPEGSYALTEYGKTMLQLSRSFEFVHKYRAYFSSHAIQQIPHEFISRIGELSQTKLLTGTVNSLNVGQRMFIEAEEYGWGMVEGQAPELMIPIMEERIRDRKLVMKILVPESMFSLSGASQGIEIRALPTIPVVLAATDKGAAICFRFLSGGQVDYAGFFGNDQGFCNWAKDLFLHFWERGKRYPTSEAHW